MGIQVIWDNEEKTMLRYIFDVRWSWDDFYGAKVEAYSLLDTVHHKVGVIFDTPAKVVLPSHLITHSKSAISKTHANTSVVAIVVPNTYARTMLAMVMKLSKKAAETLRLVSTLDEARTLVADHLRQLEPSGLQER